MTSTTIASAQAIAEPVGALGGRWMLHPETLAPSKDAGYPNGFVFYVRGRGGVLGEVDASVIVSAFSFFEPGLVRMMWEMGVPVEDARAAGARYGEACAAFGEKRFADFAGAARLADLAERVVAEVDPSGLALFAGWRAEPLPENPAARAYHLLHVMRELRGSLHIVACVAHGFSPRDAVLSAGGEAQAKQFGWQEPFVDPSTLTDRRAEVEALTDRLSAATLEVLDESERAELVALVLAAREHLDASPA